MPLCKYSNFSFSHLCSNLLSPNMRLQKVLLHLQEFACRLSLDSSCFSFNKHAICEEGSKVTFTWFKISCLKKDHIEAFCFPIPFFVKLFFLFWGVLIFSFSSFLFPPFLSSSLPSSLSLSFFLFLFLLL